MTAAAQKTPEFSVNIDQSAIDRMVMLREREGYDANIKLRIAIVGGGCSGFKYAMGLTDEVLEDDQIFADNVVIDQASLENMNGSTISFQDHLTGAKFVSDNPNVSTGCGCGNSFNVKDGE